MKITKRDTPRTVTFGELKLGDRFRWQATTPLSMERTYLAIAPFAQGANCVNAVCETDGWTLVYFTRYTHVFPCGPAPEPKQVRFGELTGGDAFMRKGTIGEPAIKLYRTIIVDGMVVGAVSPKDGDLLAYKPDDLVTPLPEAEVVY